jgi:hypothetical protein
MSENKERVKLKNKLKNINYKKTLRAIREAERIATGKQKYKSYRNFQELINDIDND